MATSTIDPSKEDVSSVTDITNLKIQLETLTSTISEKVSNVFEGKQYLTQLSDAQKVLLNEIINVMKLIMVMPEHYKLHK